MKKFFRRSISALFLLVSVPAAAQFTVIGSDPGHLRWFSIDTPAYRIIYPAGTDSLARVYGLKLEQFRQAEALSSGLLPGRYQRQRTPVVLHPYHVSSNGMMLLAPRRMDLYTVPQAYEALPDAWETHLVAHESRHLSQLQFGYRGWLFRPLRYLFGDIWTGAASAIYPNMALLEGDAVVAETALTMGGRARTADFLNYYRVAFERGDTRNWYRWRYGSFKKEAPDHYALGYLTVAGMRYFYNDSLFMRRYFDRVSARPLAIGTFRREVSRASGKPFKQTFQDIAAGFNAIWAEEREARAPFQPMEQVSRSHAYATDYTVLNRSDSALYVLRSGLNRAPALLLMQSDGREKLLRPFASEASSIFYDEVRDRFYWSETVRDPRWEFSGASRIYFCTGDDFSGRMLTRHGRYYHPQPSADGERLVVVDYPVRGGSAIVILSTDDGRELARYPAPDGVQLTEGTWLDETIYASGVSDGGSGIYRLEADGRFTPIAGPSIQQVADLEAEDGRLSFISDRSGVNEWYLLDPADGTLLQMTSSPYGLTEALELNDTLYFSSQTPGGMAVFRTPVSELRPRRVRFDDVHRYRVEECLAEQEKALAGGTLPLAAPDPALLGTPKRYRKLPHLVRIHSWAPFYIDTDTVQDLSFDVENLPAGLGATAFFQNTLGTAYGCLGYRAARGGEGRPWRHSGHLKFNYTGLYPVLELTLDYNDRPAALYRRARIRYPDQGRIVQGVVSGDMSSPLLAGSLRSYVPLSLSNGGWLRGVLPQLSWGFSNDRFDRFIYPYRVEADKPEEWIYEGPEDVITESLLLHTLTASVRGYIMRPTAPSQAYPSLGIGAEAGLGGRPGLASVFAPAAFAYLYGYLPGFRPEQGLRLSALGQWAVGTDAAIRESRVNVMPRGFAALSGNALMRKSPWQYKLTADYSIPMYLGDLSFLSPLAYITHFELTPHCDATLFRGGSLVSVGASLTAGIANLLWAPFPGSIGVSASYNGGSAYKTLSAEGLPVDGRFHIGIVFSMDI